MSNAEESRQSSEQGEEDDESDEWLGFPWSGRCSTTLTFDRDQRIFRTGCAGMQRSSQHRISFRSDVKIDENTKLNDCFREKKDWRACKDEVR